MRRRALFRLVLAALPVLLLVALEGILRSLFPQPPPGFSDNLFEDRDEIAYLRSNAVGTHDTAEFRVAVRGNEQGYRLGTWPSRTGRGRKVMLLGDSFAFGWGVEAEESAAALVNRDSEHSVYNLGIPGDCVIQETQRAGQFMATPRQIDTAILLLYDNDIDEAISFGLAERHAGDGGRFDARQLLLRLHVVRLGARAAQRLGLSSLLGRADRAAEAAGREYRRLFRAQATGFFDSPEWASVAKRYDKLLGDMGQRNCEMAVVRIVPLALLNEERTNASLAALGGRTAADYDLGSLDRRLTELCAKHQASYHVFNAGSEDCFFQRDMHLNAKGHAKLAQFITRILDGAKKRE
jgi:hypothetical protein